MNDFLKFFAEKVKHYPMHIEVYYSKITDWSIHVWRKGTGSGGENEEILNIQDCDAELAFAKAQVELKSWLLEHEGGY